MDKSKLKQNIIPKTILFICIMIFILIFQAIFGSENLMVGVCTVIILLMSLGKDLTKKPIKNFLILSGINIAIGIGTYISSINPWLGIFIDFFALSLIGYYFSYSMTKGLVLPYGLQYLFLLNTPAQGEDFVKRIIALISGAIIIMVSQFIVNAKKNNSLKKEDSIIGFNEKESDKVYKEYNIFGRKVKIHKIRASYAIRVGLLTAITGFLVGYFKLAEGRWMEYSIFTLTELYAENTKIKSWKKLQGTIIGVVIVVVIFMFIKNNTLRGLLVLIAGYLNSFAEDYKDIVILVTITAVAPLAISNGITYAVLERIMYVIIGTILALIANEVILRKSESDEIIK